MTICVSEFAVVYVRHRAHVHMSQRWHPCVQREQEEQPDAGKYQPDIRYLSGSSWISGRGSYVLRHLTNTVSTVYS